MTMHKIIALNNGQPFPDISKSTYEKVISSVKSARKKIEATYNSPDDDSIFVKHIKRVDVHDEYAHVEANGGLLIDFSDIETLKKGLADLANPETVSYLECSTYLQFLFVISIAETLNQNQINELFYLASDKLSVSTDFLVRPVSAHCISIGDHLVIEDFYDRYYLNGKKNIDELDIELKVGDFIYIENYKYYPRDRNGAYAGEWCVVLKTDDEINPLLYGFGIGKKSYVKTVKNLHENCIAELEAVRTKKQIRKVLKSYKDDYIGITDVLRLKKDLFKDI
jgi:hypothetical protein